MESTLVDNGSAPAATAEEPQEEVLDRLDRLENEVRDQGNAARKIQRGFAFFAFFALLIAAVNLLVVADKLDKKSTTAAPAAAATPAAPAASAAPALGHNVGISMKEFSITPDVRQAANGRVTFNVRNDGRIKHEFVVLKTKKPAGSLLKGSEADEAGNVGEIPNLPPGSSKTLSLKLGAGHYALICNLPGHYTAGQHADLTIR